MSTEEHTSRAGSPEERELSIISQGAQALAELAVRIGPRFERAEVRSRVQRLLAEADWDEEAVRDDLRAYVMEQLGETGGILVVDETGFLKKGKKSAGVARQYSGTAGRRENCQVGVFLVYANSKGHAFIDRALYLPEEWTQDRVRCREAGIPDEVEFATKGELAQQMLTRAYASGVSADWVVGDTVYGYDELRLFLDEQRKNYVVAVPATHVVWVQGRQQPVGLLAALLPPEAWMVLSAGEGSKGPRLYEWAWLQLPE